MLTIIFYDILKFQKENINLLKSKFNLVNIPSPENDKPEILGKADAIFASLGYRFGKD